MNARDAIQKLYDDVGSPQLANFGLGELDDGRTYSAGAFVLGDRDGEVVLIRRTPIKEHPGIEDLWWLPGGAHQAGERLEETAAREFEEETGMKVTVGRFLVAHLSRERPFVALFFRGSVVEGKLSHDVDPDRITGEARAFLPSEIPFDALWGNVDRILLVREGFVDREVSDLVKKEGLRKPEKTQQDGSTRRA